jgi:hypothetical protein
VSRIYSCNDRRAGLPMCVGVHARSGVCVPEYGTDMCLLANWNERTGTWCPVACTTNFSLRGM